MHEACVRTTRRHRASYSWWSSVSRWLYTPYMRRTRDAESTGHKTTRNRYRSSLALGDVATEKLSPHLRVCLYARPRPSQPSPIQFSRAPWRQQIRDQAPGERHCCFWGCFPAYRHPIQNAVRRWRLHHRLISANEPKMHANSNFLLVPHKFKRMSPAFVFCSIEDQVEEHVV